VKQRYELNWGVMDKGMRNKRKIREEGAEAKPNVLL